MRLEEHAAGSPVLPCRRPGEPACAAAPRWRRPMLLCGAYAVVVVVSVCRSRWMQSMTPCASPLRVAAMAEGAARGVVPIPKSRWTTRRGAIRPMY